MNHAEARMLASARADGELDASRVPDLAAHLASCDPCGAFAEALPHLSALATALARERAPGDLARRVASRLNDDAPARRRPGPRYRFAPALAAALVVALIAVLVGPVPLVPVPPAVAASALSRISSLYVEREIVTFDQSGNRSGETRERVWFVAPGSIRKETVDEAGRRTLVIERPGVRYTEDASGALLATGSLPSATELPEPISPTLALIGRDVGPGPTVLGRATRRIEVDFDLERRVALIDAQTFAVLGATESVVLDKQTREGDRITAEKRTLALEYNRPIPDRLFQIPPGTAVRDAGARPRPVGSLAAPPVADPEGLALVASSAGPEGQAVLYAKGAFQILISIDGRGREPSPARIMPTRVGSRRATLVLPLYGLPEVRFAVDGHRVAVRAPLPPPQLIRLAAAFYPESGE